MTTLIARAMADRHNRLLRERNHDPYRPAATPADTIVCSRCGAYFEKGRWHWGRAPANARGGLCEACRRIADRLPAGEVILSGDYLTAHEGDIRRLIVHQERLEKAARPLNRIMAIQRHDGGLRVTTTDIHLPRRIGEALRRAHKGRCQFGYTRGGYFIRVSWQRDEHESR